MAQNKEQSTGKEEKQLINDTSSEEESVAQELRTTEEE